MCVESPYDDRTHATLSDSDGGSEEVQDGQIYIYDRPTVNWTQSVHRRTSSPVADVATSADVRNLWKPERARGIQYQRAPVGFARCKSVSLIFCPVYPVEGMGYNGFPYSPLI
jgi:hypothetical protein